MSRPKPIYWTNDSGFRECAHGTILYGTSCVRCERGEFPRAEVMGFDMGSGDETVFARVGMKNGHFTVEDILAHDDPAVRDYVNGNKDRMRAKAKEFEDILREAARDSEFVWRHATNSRARSNHYRPPPPRVEIITDPLDQRGVNARRVGDRRYAPQS